MQSAFLVKLFTFIVIQPGGFAGMIFGASNKKGAMTSRTPKCLEEGPFHAALLKPYESHESKGPFAR
jgi:hypothetical protein